jgi:hypothetical protein
MTKPERCDASLGEPDPLTCVLPAGHEGLHRTPRRADGTFFEWMSRPLAPVWEPSHREIL